ncbi:MAG: hypothetical protein Q8K70_08505 [Bacteroidota bacterium]|nr:hypothetical protein [Bacteroidota bacterium]
MGEATPMYQGGLHPSLAYIAPMGLIGNQALKGRYMLRMGTALPIALKGRYNTTTPVPKHHMNAQMVLCAP